MKFAVVLAQILLLVAMTPGLAGEKTPPAPTKTPPAETKASAKPECPPCPTCPEVPPFPAPGPIVVIKGGSGGAGISFEVNGTLQTAGPATTGLLRDDFIGQSVDYLECKNRTTGNWSPASSVSITDANGTAYRLTIEKTTQKTFWWTLEEKNATPPRTLALRPSSPTPGKVPSQFLQLSALTMRTGANVDCSEVKFRALMAP